MTAHHRFWSNSTTAVRQQLVQMGRKAIHKQAVTRLQAQASVRPLIAIPKPQALLDLRCPRSPSPAHHSRRSTAEACVDPGCVERQNQLGRVLARVSSPIDDDSTT